MALDDAIVPPAPPLADLFKLTNQVAIVTGAARGIGQATSFRLAEAGAHVIVADMNEAGAVATAAAIRDRGGSAEGVAIDVTDSAGVTSAINRVAELRGRLDILVNNAAIFPIVPFFEGDEELWRKTLDVNVMG